MDYPKFIVSNQKEESISIQKVKIIPKHIKLNFERKIVNILLSVSFGALLNTHNRSLGLRGVIRKFTENSCHFYIV